MRKAGLVGTCYISEYHLAALRRLKNVQVIGACDADSTRAAAFSARFDVPAFATLQAMRDAGAQVLHILTPPHTHADLAIEAMRLGCDVLVEKPLATDVADCERIAKVELETGRKVCVGHSLL